MTISYIVLNPHSVPPNVSLLEKPRANSLGKETVLKFVWATPANFPIACLPALSQALAAHPAARLGAVTRSYLITEIIPAVLTAARDLALDLGTIIRYSEDAEQHLEAWAQDPGYGESVGYIIDHRFDAIVELMTVIAKFTGR